MSAWECSHHDTLAGADSRSGLADLVGSGAEGWPYLNACDAAPAPGIDLRYLTLSDANGPVAFAPCFATPYNWLPQRSDGKSWPGWLSRFGTLRLVGMGSTHSNELGVHFQQAASQDDRAKMFSALLDGLDRLGEAENAHMLMVKDVNDRDMPIADPLLRRAGYARMQAPPLAYLHLPMADSDAFLAGLSGKRRWSISRNLKQAVAVEVERRASITGLEAELNELAAQTRLRAGTQFGGLEASSDQFFGQLAETAPDNCEFTLFRVEGKLIGFSLMLADKTQMFGKTIGLSYPEARDHKVYFRNLINGVDATTARGLDWLCLGQLGYETKMHLGAKLERRWYYVKTRGNAGRGFGLVRPFIEGRRIEAESAPFDAPEHYFSAQPDGPQPPAHLLFGGKRRDAR